MTKPARECPVCGKKFRGAKGRDMHYRDVHEKADEREAAE